MLSNVIGVLKGGVKKVNFTLRKILKIKPKTYEFIKKGGVDIGYKLKVSYYTRIETYQQACSRVLAEEQVLRGFYKEANAIKITDWNIVSPEFITLVFQPVKVEKPVKKK